MPTVPPNPIVGKGTRVKYARSPRVQLDITTELIEQSLQRDSSHCMIAEAVKAAVPGARSVSVDLQTIRFTDPDKPHRYTYLTPRRAQIALVNFDQGREPEPFQVQLRGGAVTKTVTRSARKKFEDKEAAIATKSGKAPKTEPKVDNRAVVAKRRTLTKSDADRRNVPEVNGGTTPPLGPLASITTARGRRRAFGLRLLEM